MSKHAHIASTFSLLTSASTLVCCALPALMVALGAGAALAMRLARQITAWQKPAGGSAASAKLFTSSHLAYMRLVDFSHFSHRAYSHE